MINQQEWQTANRVAVSEFIKELGGQGKCLRLSALYEQLWDEEEELKERCQRYKQASERDAGYLERTLIASYIPDIEKHIASLKMRIRLLLAEAEGKGTQQITTDMILRAKDYPIESLLPEARHKGNYLCISHSEHNPSMSTKNNRVYCFSCGYHGDSIDVYMTLHNSSFAEAVRRLQ